MRKSKIEDIFELFLQCLPRSAYKPLGVVVYNSWRRMIEEVWEPGERKKMLKMLEDNKRRNLGLYARSKRLESIHRCGSGGKSPVGAIATDPISIYSRPYRGAIAVLIVLLHETAHLNGYCKEKDAEEWMWRRWPYVYGKYKRLRGRA